MKKIILFSFALILGFTSQAQNEDYRIVLGLSAGYSLTGQVADAVGEIAGDDIETSVTPPLQLTFDYGLTNWLSIGVAGSFQNIQYTDVSYTYVNDAFESITESNIKTDRNRTTIALRPLFHYANSDKLDMYSGLRIQLVGNSLKTDSEDPEFPLEAYTGITDGSRIGVGIVAWGCRYYFTDNIGAGLEIMWGAPYVTALSVNARF